MTKAEKAAGRLLRRMNKEYLGEVEALIKMCRQPKVDLSEISIQSYKVTVLAELKDEFFAIRMTEDEMEYIYDLYACLDAPLNYLWECWRDDENYNISDSIGDLVSDIVSQDIECISEDDLIEVNMDETE